MSDIVERLMKVPQRVKEGFLIFWSHDYPLCREAAAEILRLRAENEKLQWELGKALDTLVAHDAVCAENEKLRAEYAALVDKYDEQFLEIEKLRAERDNFYIEYRMVCDEECKIVHAENEKLRTATTELLSHYYDAMRRDGYADEEVRSEHVFLAAAAALKETG